MSAGVLYPGCPATASHGDRRLGPGNDRRFRDGAGQPDRGSGYNRPGRVAYLLAGRRAVHNKGPGRGRNMKGFLVLLIISGLALADEGDALKDQPAKFKITTKRKDDTVEVHAEKDRAVFSVKSPFGISQAVIERTDDDWRKVVVLRLHLKGLSSFRASNGKVKLEAAVSLQEGKPKVRLWKDG